MKIKFLIASLVLGASISSYAQGYKDGIEYYKIDKWNGELPQVTGGANPIIDLK